MEGWRGSPLTWVGPCKTVILPTDLATLDTMIDMGWEDHITTWLCLCFVFVSKIFDSTQEACAWKAEHLLDLPKTEIRLEQTMLAEI